MCRSMNSWVDLMSSITASVSLAAVSKASGDKASRAAREDVIDAVVALLVHGHIHWEVCRRRGPIRLSLL